MSFVDDLRQVADFLEARPELLKTMNPDETLNICAPSKERFSQLAKVFGSAEKISTGMYYVHRKHFGSIKLDLFASKSVTCERVVVGTKRVEAQHVEAYDIPAREEEVVEWRCPESILREGGESSEELVPVIDDIPF